MWSRPRSGDAPSDTGLPAGGRIDKGECWQSATCDPGRRLRVDQQKADLQSFRLRDLSDKDGDRDRRTGQIHGKQLSCVVILIEGER
jgi:hypothetical protein